MTDPIYTDEELAEAEAELAQEPEEPDNGVEDTEGEEEEIK